MTATLGDLLADSRAICEGIQEQVESTF